MDRREPSMYGKVFKRESRETKEKHTLEQSIRK